MNLARRLLRALTVTRRLRAELDGLRMDIRQMADELYAIEANGDERALRHAVDDHVRELLLICALRDGTR